MGYSGNIYLFKDKKELKSFQRELIQVDKEGSFGNDFFNLMSRYFDYETSGKFLLTTEQLKEVSVMATNVMKQILEGYVEYMIENDYTLMYVDGSY